MGERKISNGTAGIMTAIAFILDGTNIVFDFITFGTGGIFMDVIIGGIFTIWFSHLGASLWSSNTIGWTLCAAGFSAFPITNLSFPWTARVASHAFTARHQSTSLSKVKTKPAPKSRGTWRL